MPSLPTLPFLPIQPDINNWLNRLNQYGSHRASTMLLDVLQTLYQQSSDANTNLLVLNALVMPVMMYADELEHLLLQQDGITTSLHRKTANLSCQILRGLCLNYAKNSIAQNLSPAQHLSTLYLGLYITGLWQYKLAVLNLYPSKTAWKLTAELYKRAQQYQLLNQAVTASPLIAPKQHTIAEVLQRNLLFSLCDAYHFDHRHINKIFAFVDRYFALIKIDVSAHQAHFIWAHRQLQAPMPFVKTAPVLPQALYINCQTVADLLFIENPLALPKTELHHLQQYLIGYKDIIESSVHTTSVSCKLVADYFQIHDHLHQQTALNNIFRVSTATGKSAPRPNLLQLMPLDTHAQKPTAPVSSMGTGIYPLHPTHTPNFFVTITTDSSVQPGIPVALIASSDQIKLGILRQISAHSVTMPQQILIEHIPGTIESVQVIVDGEASLGLLIAQTNDAKALLLPPGKYQIGIALIVIRQSRQETYSLARLIEYTARYVHFQIKAD